MSPFAVASPLIRQIVDHEVNSSDEKSTQRTFIFHEVSSGKPGVREMTRQQWEKLKPLIKRIYIDENKPSPYLAKILRDEYSFEPT